MMYNVKIQIVTVMLINTLYHRDLVKIEFDIYGNYTNNTFNKMNLWFFFNHFLLD